jgi:hypothetical protein
MGTSRSYLKIVLLAEVSELLQIRSLAQPASGRKRVSSSTCNSMPTVLWQRQARVPTILVLRSLPHLPGDRLDLDRVPFRRTRKTLKERPDQS